MPPPCRTPSPSGCSSPPPSPASSTPSCARSCAGRRSATGLPPRVRGRHLAAYEGGVPGKIHLGLDLRGASTSCSRSSSRTRSTRPSTTRSRPHATRPTARASSSAPSSGSRRRRSRWTAPSRRASRTCAISSGTSSERVEVRDAGEGKFTVEMTDIFQRQLKDQTVKEAIRTLERRERPRRHGAGDRGDRQPRRPDPGADARRDRRRASQAHHQDDAQLTSSSSRAPRPRPRRRCCRAWGARSPTTWRCSPDPRTPGQPTYYLVRKEAMITGRDLKGARGGGGGGWGWTRTTARRSTSPERPRHRQVRPRDGEEHRPPARIVLDGDVYSAP